MRKNFRTIKSWQTMMLSGLLLAGGAAVPVTATAAPAPQHEAGTAANVSGTVVDETGEPLIGATVLVKGTANGTATDLDGNFTLKAPQGATLTVSYVGYQPKEVKVNGTQLNITMAEDTALLDEVVVVGYGTQKKATMTGSVTVVDDRAMQDKGSLSSPVQALQGQVPGVIVTRGSSAPGDEGWNMTLRGAVSKNSASPLVIIDGVEYESVNDLRLINPSDIESMNFLKDAAASIYGSKAAGGVILITTKSAKGGSDKVKVDYQGSFTYKHIGLVAEEMSLDEWADALIQARTNDGYNPLTDTWLRYAQLAKIYKNKWIDGNPLGMGGVEDMVFFDTDWHDVMWGDSWSTNHEVSVSGGSAKNNYRISLGYMYDDSPLKWGNNHNQRFNFRINHKAELFKGFTLQSVVAYNRQDQVAPTQIGSALKTGSQQPGFPASTIDGKPYAWDRSWYTPNWIVELGGDNKLKVNALNISETMRYEIFSGFTANAVVGWNHSSANRDTKTLPVEFYSYNGTKRFDIPLQQDTKYETTWASTDFFSVQGYLDWDHTFREAHNLRLMAGVQYNIKQYNYSGLEAKDISGALDVPNGSGDVKISHANAWEEAIMSYYGRANYDYLNKYMVEAQARYDGSSKFQPENRWAFFWGASLGWRISQESFMENARGWLNELKLRASYGNVGNQAGIDRYSGVLLYEFVQTGGNILGGTLASTIDTNGQLVSTDRTWERVHNYNVALDFGFFSNRLSGTVEAFWKRTNNMLIDVLYPGILGDKAPTANLGKFKAWGYEGNINWSDRIGEVGYHVGGTFTYADNELVDNGGSGALKAGVRSDREGYPLNSVFGYQYCGKIQTDEQLQKYIGRYGDNNAMEGNMRLLRLGDNMFVDQNGDGRLDENDLIYLGSDDPKIQYSFNLGADWNGFDINIVFQGAGMRTVWRTDNNGNPDTWRIPMRNAYQNSSNHFIGDVWSPETPDNRYPSLTNESGINNYNYQCSSWSVNDGSYLRLKNITVGYSLPQSVLAKQKALSSVRFYVTGTDLWEMSHIHDGWDPEAKRNISTSARYPFLRTWTIGANITF